MLFGIFSIVFQNGILTLRSITYISLFGYSCKIITRDIIDTIMTVATYATPTTATPAIPVNAVVSISATAAIGTPATPATVPTIVMRPNPDKTHT